MLYMLRFNSIFDGNLLNIAFTNLGGGQRGKVDLPNITWSYGIRCGCVCTAKSSNYIKYSE